MLLTSSYILKLANNGTVAFSELLNIRTHNFGGHAGYKKTRTYWPSLANSKHIEFNLNLLFPLRESMERHRVLHSHVI